MSAGLKRAGTTVLFAAALLCGACDNAQSQADKQIRADLSEARHLARTQDTLDSAKTKLASAAGNDAGSQGARAQAMAARAQAEMDTARLLTRQVDSAELELSRVNWGIIELAQQIRSSGSAVAGYKKYDPKPVKEAIEAKLAEARGGADKPAWFAHNSAAVPTLATVTQELTRLQAELTQRNAEMNDLNGRRARLIDQAEQAAIQANSLKGQESLAPFTRASDLRKQSGDIGVQMDQLKNQIGRLEQSVAVTKGQQAVVNDVVTQLQEQSTQLDQAWQKYDAQSAAHQQLSAKMLGTAGTGDQSVGAVGGTIAQKAAEVDRLVKQIQQLRADAMAAANNATEFFSKAYDAATAGAMELNQRAGQYPDRPEAAAWKGMAASLNPSQHRLQQAAVQRLIADLHASEAASLGSRLEVRETVQTALGGTGLSVPGPLSGGDLNTLRQNALRDADAAYKSSDELLEQVTSGTAPADLKNRAHVDRALGSYGWAQLARQMKNETVARAHIIEAKAARDLAYESNAAIPPMPAELGPPPKPATPAPEAPAPENAPASGPSTAPATEPTI